MSITPLHRPTSEKSEVGDCSRSSDAVVDEAELVRSIAEGDAAALEQLLSLYWQPLTSYASRILDDMSLAEDVVQQVFVALWTRKADWAPRSVRAYLFRATRNLAIDEYRGRQARQLREHAHGALLDHRVPPTPDALLEESSRVDAVNRAIQMLPRRRREAFVLAYLERLSYHEIAEIMGISLKTVGHHVSAALAELRRALDDLTEKPPENSDDRAIRPLYPDPPARSD